MTCFVTKEEFAALEARVSRLEALVKQFCYDTECNRIEQIAIEAKRKAIQVELDLNNHKAKSIPQAHKYTPSVNVFLSGSFYQNVLNITCAVRVDNTSGSNSTNIPIFLSSLKGDPGKNGKDGRDGKNGKDGKNGRSGRDGINGKDGKNGGRGRDGINGLPGKGGKDGRNGRDEKGSISKPKPINCGLTLRFDPVSCLLTANMRVDNCFITANVSMKCDNDSRIINRIYKILGGDDWFRQGEDPSITLDVEQRIKSLVQAQWGLEAEKTVEELELKNVIDVVSGFLSCNYFRAGYQEYPFNVVEDLTKKVDEDTTKKINYQSQFDEWRFKQLDALFGQFPIKIKIEDNDLIKTGDEPLEIELPNLAETLAELTGKTLFNEAMLNLLVNINFRLLNEQGSTKLQGFSTNKMVEEIVDYLGFENQKIKEKIRFLYNPSYNITEGEQPSFEEILKETEIDVDVEECTEKRSFEQKLDQLLFSAAIIQTALYEKVNPNNLSKWGDFVKEYKDLVDAFSDDKEKEDDELDQFIEKVEEGFTGETGIIDSTNPYGRPRDQRPRIRKIGNPNSNTGGNNGGN